MSSKELISMIKKSKSCFAWVNIYQEDGEYLQINKSTLIFIVKKADEAHIKLMLKGDYSENATFNLREDGDLYVN